MHRNAPVEQIYQMSRIREFRATQAHYRSLLANSELTAAERSFLERAVAGYDKSIGDAKWVCDHAGTLA